MAKTGSKTPRGDGALRSADVPDQTVSMVGKAAMEVMKVRESLAENMAIARTDEERESLTEQAETAAVRAISEQGITVAEYNEVIAAAQSDPELEERVLTACRES